MVHLTNIPLVLSSLTFVIPYFAAIETHNPYSAVCWGALTCTSTFVHITKRPHHIYGPGNCIPCLYAMDILALYFAVIRALVDGYFGGIVGLLMSCTIVTYAGFVFYVGRYLDKFVFDKYVDMSILSHVSVHLLASFGGTAVIYLRAFKNGLENS